MFPSVLLCLLVGGKPVKPLSIIYTSMWIHWVEYSKNKFFLREKEESWNAGVCGGLREREYVGWEGAWTNIATHLAWMPGQTWGVLCFGGVHRYHHVLSVFTFVLVQPKISLGTWWKRIRRRGSPVNRPCSTHGESFHELWTGVRPGTSRPAYAFG